MQESEEVFGDGRYIVRRELGRGTMGVVYEADDTLLARTVAVKTIDLLFGAASENARTDFERRFFREARVAAQLSHPGIVVCHDVGKDATSGRLYIVFEHLKGRTLEDRSADGPMDWREALGVVIQLARAIHHAHEHGVVHRDLKPANVMLLERGPGTATSAHADPTVKVMDFGVARVESLGQRITRTGQAFGSPLYMSPEQALGQPSSARSDIFSVGSVLCTLILGRPWFEAPSLPKIVDRLAHDDPPRLSRLRPGVPPSLDLVVAKALAKRESDRYRNASEMADDLEDVLAGRAPRHAFGPLPSPGGASEEEGLLAGLTGGARAPRGSSTSDPLASLLEDAPAPATAAKTGPMPPAPAAPLAPGGGSTLVTTGRRRHWLAAAGALFVLAVLAVGALVWPRAPRAPEPAPRTSVPAATSEPPAFVAESEAVPPPTAAPVPTLAPLPEAAAPPATAPTDAPAAAPVPSPRIVRPTPQATPPVVTPLESAPTSVPVAVEEPDPSPSTAPNGSRIRLNLEHPFEDGRLIVWIDGVLVHDAKLHAPNSRRIVAFKVREGRAETMLDVTPGKHEVRVEVTWNQGRTARAKVVDVAEGATGLLEARVGRMSKDLSLTWSRLATD